MFRMLGGKPASRAIWPKIHAVAGVSSAALTTAVLPHIRAGKTFQAMFAIGVLAAMIRPATPTGWRIVMAYLLAAALVVVRPYIRWPSPAMNKPRSTAPSVSPRADGYGLPV